MFDVKNNNKKDSKNSNSSSIIDGKVMKMDLDTFKKTDFKELKKKKMIEEKFKEEIKKGKITINKMCASVCKSVLLKNPCKFVKKYGKCKYAHSVEELIVKQCKFNKRCIHGRNCKFKHDYESIENYYRRQGFTNYRSPHTPYNNNFFNCIKTGKGQKDK